MATAAVADRSPRDDEIDFFGVTHTGAVRTVNQDNFLIASIRRKVEAHLTSLPSLEGLPIEGERIALLAMVADGVGGGPMGEAASRFAVEAVTQYVIKCIRLSAFGDTGGTSDFPRALENAAREVHQELLRQTENDPALGGMATTLTLWIGMWPRSYILQVGDSRCYVLRDGELTQLSRDQTMAQDLIDSGILTQTDAYRTRWVNVLSSAIGGSQNTPVVSYLHQVWGTVGLLCSDGLTKHVSDERIRERLRNMTSAKQVCEALVQDALDGGGSDNITVVVGRTIRKD
ncbi:MAG TPA: protein phosphatase 2C domain-containing protein [Gemmatimonadaceae bacterium]|nr:protein phosphatase 2C domain-containing protein [Gemmatimonadaceae bacterium]